MEEKEISSASGSLGILENESPPQVSNSVPQVMNMAVAISMGAATAPASGGGGQASSVADLFGKKKRGRPRKYDSDGNLRVTYPPAVASPPGFSLSPSSPPSDFSSFKRGRGRPSGSGNWQLLASSGELFAETAGGDFTPHVVTVNTGEDVAGKILAFAQKGPRGICILSANGAVSNVTFRQPGSSGGILTYEGRFEILSLSGSFTVTDTGGVRSRTGGLSASLAGPDGRVVGGGIAGLLVAASPIQIVAGSFMPNGYKAHKRKHFREHGMPSMIQGAPETVTAATPISQAKPDPVLTHLSSASPWPLPGQSHGEANNSTRSKQIQSTISSQTTGWNDSERASDQRPYPDINVSVLGE